MNVSTLISLLMAAMVDGTDVPVYMTTDNSMPVPLIIVAVQRIGEGAAAVVLLELESP